MYLYNIDKETVLFLDQIHFSDEKDSKLSG